MSFLKISTPRRSLVRGLLALPVLSLLRLPPPRDETPREFVEVDGWILKRSDLL